jgi:hypothetical protein
MTRKLRLLLYADDGDCGGRDHAVVILARAMRTNLISLCAAETKI